MLSKWALRLDVNSETVSDSLNMKQGACITWKTEEENLDVALHDNSWIARRESADSPKRGKQTNIISCKCSITLLGIISLCTLPDIEVQKRSELRSYLYCCVSFFPVLYMLGLKKWNKSRHYFSVQQINIKIYSIEFPPRPFFNPSAIKGW